MPVLNCVDFNESNKLGSKNVGIQLLKKQKTLIQNENRNQNLLNTSSDSIGLQQLDQLEIQPKEKIEDHQQEGIEIEIKVKRQSSDRFIPQRNGNSNGDIF